MKLVVDLHTHTVASGHAFSTVKDNAEAAAAKGLEVIAITDHGPNLPGGAHNFHFWNLRVLPEEIAGVRILRGAEANIVDNNGALDLDEDTLRSLDVVAIGFHPQCGYEGKTVEQNTGTLIKAMSLPYVHIVVHPGNPWFPIDPERIVEAAGKYDVLLELNNSSFVTSRPGGEDISRDILNAAYKGGLDIILGSDAHIDSAVGEFGEAVREAEEAGFSADRIINTNKQRVLEFLKSKKKGS
jgi:putative hydrolase